MLKSNNAPILEKNSIAEESKAFLLSASCLVATLASVFYILSIRGKVTKSFTVAPNAEPRSQSTDAMKGHEPKYHGRGPGRAKLM